MLEVTACVDEPDELTSLEVYNTVWPHDAVTIDAVHAFRDSARDYIVYLVREDGVVLGCGVWAIFASRARRVVTLITVLAGHRRRGAGTALYAAICRWASERGAGELEVSVAGNDPGSLSFAQRRGFTEERREVGRVLSLAGIAPPQVQPPDGIEIVTWAQRPELARGMYEVDDCRPPGGPVTAMGRGGVAALCSVPPGEKGGGVMTQVTEHLQAHGVPFEPIAHQQAYTSIDEARALGIEASEVLKTVAVRAAGGYALMAILATGRLDMHLVQDAVGDRHARLATEQELLRDFPGFELGALPPLGSLLGVPLYVDQEVLRHETVAFAAGSQTESVQIRTADLLQHEQATALPLIKHADENDKDWLR